MSWTCPKCERELRNPNQWHNCVKVSIDSLFEGKSDELIIVFDRILSQVIDWEDVVVSATQNCIVFVHRKTFLIIKPMKTQLDVKFYSTEKLEQEMILKSIPYSGKYENHIRISSTEGLTGSFYRLIKDSYQLL
jgi:hypothetical protein